MTKPDELFQGLTATAEIEDSKDSPKVKAAKEKEPRALAMEERDRARADGMIEGMGRAMTMLNERAYEVMGDGTHSVGCQHAEWLFDEVARIGREMWRTFGERARHELELRGFKVPEFAEPQTVMVDELEGDRSA